MKNERITILKYIDPMSDFGFKKIFKESGKKQLLIRPLNAIFGLCITDLEIRESEHVGLTPRDRAARFDLDCESSDGKHFIVEVQVSGDAHFARRALYYASYPIIESAKKGRRDGEAWDFDVPPVFFLGLLNFDFRELEGQADADPAQFIHRFSLREVQTGARLTDGLQFAFLEIKRFDKGREACVNFEEKFLYMMKNLPNFATEPALWDDPYFADLLEEAEYAGMSRQEQKRYKTSLQMGAYQDQIDYAEVRGRRKGHAEGLVQGHAEGKAESQQAIARRMLAKGMPVEIVAELTELTEEQIRYFCRQ